MRCLCGLRLYVSLIMLRPLVYCQIVCVLFLSIIIARLQLRFDQVAALDEGKRREVYDTDILPAGRPGGALMAPLTLRFDSILDNYNERCA